MASPQTWDPNSWKWDPYKLVATPAGESSNISKKLQDVTADFSTSCSDEQAELASSKRISRSDGPITCQVDGCLTDLTGLKEYHNRYKICQYHLKIPCIIRNGNGQRFCQQCGRFHNISEFDGDKRSCRARLQRHNARRRKKGETEPAKGVRRQPKSERSSASLGTSMSVSQGLLSDVYVAGNSDALSNSPDSNEMNQPPTAQLSDNKLATDWNDFSTSAGLALDSAFTEFLAQEDYHAKNQGFQHDTSMEESTMNMSHDDSTLTNQVTIRRLHGHRILQHLEQAVVATVSTRDLLLASHACLLCCFRTVCMMLICNVFQAPGGNGI